MSGGTKTAYYLYDFAVSKTETTVKVIRKSQLHAQNSDKECNQWFFSYRRPILTYFYSDNFIAGLDFNSSGETVATIDKYGICLISDINTNDYIFHLDLNMSSKFGMFF